MGRIDLVQLDGEYLSTTEAARRLGITKMAMSKRVAMGTFPARQVITPPGGRRFYAIPAWAVVIENQRNELLLAGEANDDSA